MLLFFLSRQMVLRTWQAFFTSFFFSLSNLVSEILGDDKAIPFLGRSQRNSHNDSYPSFLDI